MRIGEDCPREPCLLRAGSHGLSDGLQEIIEDDLLFSESLELLHQFSLVERSQRKDSIVIHRLIQAVLMDEVSETEVNQYLAEVIGICNAAFPKTGDTKE